MNILQRLSDSSRPGRKSWWPFIAFALFVILPVAYRAAIENDIASRQKTSFGTIGQCEERGRGRDTYCDYSFLVGDALYTAVGNAERGLGIGETVTVYYDSQNPRSSALEDFSEQSRANLRIVYILGLVLVAVVALVLWARAP